MSQQFNPHPPPQRRPLRMGRWQKLAYLLSALLYLLKQQSSLWATFAKLPQLWQRIGWRGLKQLLLNYINGTVVYARWVHDFDSLSSNDRLAIRQHIGTFGHRPIISILMPVYDPPEPWLRRAIASVRQQLYPDWELCIADDASTQPYVRTILAESAQEDSRIKLFLRNNNGHIAAATNDALRLASGDFVALLDHDDELPEHALYMIAEALQKRPDLDLLFSDEDKIDDRGRRQQPYFKPDWNADLLLSQNCVSHLGVFRTSLVRQAGGLRKGVEGCQDWDLVLRLSALTKPERIFHIPHVLYHWRIVKGSTSAGHESKGYVANAAQRVVTDHLARIGDLADVEPASGAFIRVRYRVPRPQPRVSIIIPTRNGLQLLQRCVESVLAHTDYSDYEIVVVDNQSDAEDALSYLSELEERPKVRVLRYDAIFNFSAIMNFAVGHTDSPLLCLLNNDTEAIGPGWLTEMVGHALRPEIGVVGAMLYYPDDSIQHAGVIIGLGGVAGHWHAGAMRGIRGYAGRAGLTQNFSAVTAACMVLRRDIYQQVGGMDAERLAVAYNDIDFCLRVRSLGYRILWTPFAELYHHESASRGKDETPEKRLRFQQESEAMHQRWSEWISNDPAYNPNLSLTSAWPYLARPPRVSKPWRDGNDYL